MSLPVLARRRRLFASTALLLRSACILAVLGGAGACSEAPLEATSAAEQSVLYGTVSGPEEDAVVMVVSKGDGVIHTCTGTLLAANVVITARHCIANFVDAAFTCTSDGELVPNSPGGRMGSVLDPAAITIRIGTKPPARAAATATHVFATTATTICRNDIAVVVVDPPLVDLPIVPVRLGKGVSRGEALRVVGYGVDDMNLFGTRHTRSGLSIAQVGTSEFSSTGDAVPPRTFVTNGPALCIGDSGGPAFADSGATVGVWSQVVGECDGSAARNFFTQIAPYEKELLEPAFEAAGALLWREGTTGPGEEPASGGSAGSPSTESGGSGGSEVSSGGTDSSSGGTEPSSGGSSSSGGASEDTGGTTSAAGSNTFGLRKKGGCQCETVGGSGNTAAGLALPALVFGLLGRRRSKARR